MTWRRRLRLLGLVLGGLALLVALRIVAGKACGSWALARAERAFEREVGPFDLAHWAPPESTAEGEATAVLRRAAAAVQLGPGPADARLLLVREPVGSRRPQLVEAARAWVAGNEAVLESLRTLPSLPAAGFGDPARHVRGARASDDYEPSTTVAHLLAADAYLALATGDRARAAKDLSVLRVLVGMLRHQVTWIGHMVASSVEKAALEVARGLLAEGDEVESRQVASELAVLGGFPGVLAAIAGEAIVVREMVLRSGIEGGSGGPGSGYGPLTSFASPFTADHLAADGLQTAARLSRAATVPTERWPPAWRRPAKARGALAALVWPLAPLPIHSLGLQELGMQRVEREQYLTAARTLGLLAAACVLAGSADPKRPCDLATLPGGTDTLLFSEEPPQLRRLADGGWVIEAPRAIARVGEVFPEPGDRMDAQRERLRRLLSWPILHPPRAAT